MLDVEGSKLLQTQETNCMRYKVSDRYNIIRHGYLSIYLLWLVYLVYLVYLPPYLPAYLHILGSKVNFKYSTSLLHSI